MLSDNGFTPPEMTGAGESGIQQPPASFETALAAYGKNSGEDDLLSQLINLLQSDSSSTSDSSSSTYSSINITS